MDKSDIMVRQAGPDDYRIAAEHYLGMRHDLGWSDDALFHGWREKFVAAHRAADASGQSRYFVAELDGAAVGTGLAMLRPSIAAAYVPAPLRGYLAHVFVEPHARRRGVARALTVAALQWLRERGCTNVRLIASDAGRPLYASMGFVQCNEMVLRFDDAENARKP
jgi:GNAT superfamily N-acetyltransferase